jgi:hypothetical protein
VIEMPIILDNDGDDREAGLDGEVEAALLEWQQVRVLAIMAGAFWIHPQGYL